MNRRREALGVFLGVTLVLGINSALLIPGGFVVMTFLMQLIAWKILPKNPQDVQGYGVLLTAINSISIYQFLYVGPLIWYLKKKQYWGFMKGVIAGSVLTALLTGICFVNFLGPAFG